uniref:Uncharacterized protein n=1 Tax=Salarias fasciatus TaxID=181472 RepID=A0A672JCH6_SALFA
MPVEKGVLDRHKPRLLWRKRQLLVWSRWRQCSSEECGHPIDTVHCSSELLSSNHPPASASRELGLQARATAPGENHLHSQRVSGFTNVETRINMDDGGMRK